MHHIKVMGQAAMLGPRERPVGLPVDPFFLTDALSYYRGVGKTASVNLKEAKKKKPHITAKVGMEHIFFRNVMSRGFG